MRYFAKLSAQDIVTGVYVFGESESDKEIADFLGTSIDKVKESVDRKENSHPAEVGSQYNRVHKKFLEQRPYTSWRLNPQSLFWEAPISVPVTFRGDGVPERYFWSEEGLSWIKDTIED